MRKILWFIVTFNLLLTLIACSLPPERPVTRQDLMQTRVYDKYLIEESPEELLYALNTRGEVVVESQRNIPGKEFLIYLKLLATADGVEVLEYDR
ncbi:MAG: hypothetical protein JRE16_09630 [Deltaproteobacteria bacterium]|nr:hypothetical protein [Deltaproteobacteria bacterium]MBW2504816.1 hypothetical protein [Deltaproteobacteria bacterium]